MESGKRCVDDWPLVGEQVVCCDRVEEFRCGQEWCAMVGGVGCVQSEFWVRFDGGGVCGKQG